MLCDITLATFAKPHLAAFFIEINFYIWYYLTIISKTGLHHVDRIFLQRLGYQKQS